MFILSVDQLPSLSPSLPRPSYSPPMDSATQALDLPERKRLKKDEKTKKKTPPQLRDPRISFNNYHPCCVYEACLIIFLFSVIWREQA